MNKGLAIFGGVLTLVSLFSLGYSLVVMDSYEPNSDNILHDTETDGTVFNFDGSSNWLEVYAKGEVDCYSYSVSVTDDVYEYFIPYCDESSDVNGYTYVGDIEVYVSGSYNIVADGDVVIVDADDLFGPVFAFCGGGFCCLLGIILLIVGFSIGRKAPQMVVFQQPDGTIYQPNQTTIQQYIPPSTEQPNQQHNAAQSQVQQSQNIPPAFDEDPDAVPVYQTDFDGFSFEHKKSD